MSKHFNPIEEGKNEGDIAKRVLRNISVVAQSLDNVRGRAQVVSDLFQPAVQVLRYKLHELSDRLILIDPEVQGKRGEDTLWKKGYHEIFTAAKRLKQGDSWNENEVGLIRGFLYCGVGHYQQLIFRLQAEYNLHLDGVVDFSQDIVDYGLSKGKSSGKQDEAPWADALVFRCLLYLGDLARYMNEVQPESNVELAERYYSQAAILDCKQGRPYNQLGTLSAGRNYSLDAVYYYMRSLFCAEPFQRAEGNLSNALEKIENSVQVGGFNSKSLNPVAKVISFFLVAVDAWYLKKNVENLPAICSEFIGQMHDYLFPCGKTKIVQIAKNESEILNCSSDSSKLSVHVNLKIFAIMCMCWKKNHLTDLSMQTMVMASILAVVEIILKKIVELCKIFESEQNKGRGRRRRRRRGSVGSSASDISDGGSVGNADSGDSEESSEDEAEPIANGHTNGNNRLHKPKSVWIEDDSMSILYIFCSWLRFNSEDLSICSNNTKPIFLNLISVLNSLSSYLNEETEYEHFRESQIPSFEDHHLRGLPGLEKSHAELDWSMNNNRLSLKEFAALRGYRILSYGAHLPKVYLDLSTRRFEIMESKPTSPIITTPTEGKGKLMKNMGQLWLQAEVKDLENRTKKTPNGYSPYLVVDADALIDHIHLVKPLVASRQFIVVIPSVVIAQLDEFKRESGRARETIRWLEAQFQHGNRHLRTQKTQEKASLGVIKCPKKKDKDAWNFFQMMECCSYLANQSELRCKGSGKVTFLTGAQEKALNENRTAPDFSPSGLASTFGVALENIENFYSKWRLSSKSNG